MKTISYQKKFIFTPSNDHYYKEWGKKKIIQSKDKILFSSYFLPGINDLINFSSLDYKRNDELYVVCPQYSTLKDGITDSQMTVTGKITIDEINKSNGTLLAAKREIAEETGLEILDSNIYHKALRMGGKIQNKPVSINNYYCEIDNKTKTFTNNKEHLFVPDTQKKVQILMVGKLSTLLSIFSNEITPLESNDNKIPSDPTKSYISGIRLISFNDILTAFNTMKQQYIK